MEGTSCFCSSGGRYEAEEAARQNGSRTSTGSWESLRGGQVPMDA